MTERAVATALVRTRATALGAREQAAALRAATRALRATSGQTRECAAALRRLGAERRHVPAPLALVTAQLRAAGRLVRSAVRRRHAAATGDPPPSRAPTRFVVPGAPDERWASATVYAVRTVVTQVAPAADAAAPNARRVRWIVRELDASAMPGARGPRCLVFEHDESVRRVWDYPASWTTLAAVDLLRLAGLAP